MKKIFYFCFFICLILLSGSAAAQVQLETGLPNIPGNRLDAGKELPQYINYLFIFGLGAITILALAQMMTGGIKYILAAGNVGEKADAKDTIQQALLGLGLLLASYLLLKTINPDLVNLRNPNLTPAQFKGEIPPGMSVEDYLKQFCKPYNCASQCKTDCAQGVWDNDFCGCKTSPNNFYNIVPAVQCTGKAVPPPMVNTPCESSYKSAPGLYKNSVCCETPK